NDFWEYDPSVNMWRWLTGDTTTYPLSKYGSKNVLASGNIPGCRSHATMESVNGKIYLLGGNAASSTVCCGMTNEMWMYDPNSGYWAWVNGADTFSERGRYGIKGVYDSANVISAGMLSASWVVKNRLYVLGGTRLLTNVFTGLQLTYNNNALWGCEVCDTLQNCYSTTPSIDLADTTILCNNKTLYLNAGNIGCRYLWSTGDTSQSIGVSIPGICWVKVTNPIGLTTTDTTTVVTGSTPILNLGTDTSICEGEMLLLDAYNKNAKYYWNTGDTSHKINVVSTQRYIVWVVSANMCYGSDSIYVEVKSNPKVPRLGSNSPVCAGDKLVVVDSNSIVGNFKIYGPNSLEIPSNIYTNYNATSLDSGLYYIVDSSNGCISTDTTYVQVFRRFNPIVSITTSPSVNVWPFVMLTFKANVDYDSANTNYKWYQNKNELASETRSTYSAIAYSVVKHNDVICVEIKNPSKCALIDTASDCEQPIIVRLSVDDKLTQEKSIDVSPNPFHDRIDINGTIANAIIELYDVMGRRVYRSIADGNTKSINTGYLANGNYYLKVTHLNADPIVIKIVKE
ncbi:MAG: T9SS type A sorting domain-containing protein, partial [Chitinophagaceae bacterium]|nr:T9SS type A sorting domain-containing protein [Chitinophagaceae bacterium]